MDLKLLQETYKEKQKMIDKLNMEKECLEKCFLEEANNYLEINKTLGMFGEKSFESHMNVTLNSKVSNVHKVDILGSGKKVASSLRFNFENIRFIVEFPELIQGILDVDVLNLGKIRIGLYEDSNTTIMFDYADDLLDLKDKFNGYIGKTVPEIIGESCLHKKH